MCVCVCLCVCVYVCMCVCVYVCVCVCVVRVCGACVWCVCVCGVCGVCGVCVCASWEGLGLHVGALIIRIGFWGVLYHNCEKQPPPPHSIGSNIVAYIEGLESKDESGFLGAIFSSFWGLRTSGMKLWGWGLGHRVRSCNGSGGLRGCSPADLGVFHVIFP